MNLSILNGFSRITPADMDDAQVDKNSKSSTGYSRYYDGNEPHRGPLDGYSRVVFSDRELQGLSLQGLSLQGQTILQGYSLGDAQDLEEWEYLVNIEHPTVLQGFQNFVLNGPRKKLKQKRQEKKAAKAASSSTQSVRPKKAKRLQRQSAKSEAKTKARAIRTAKKEEKLLRKSQDAAAKRLRKQTKAERSVKKKALKEASKQLKTQMKAGRGGKLAEFFGNAAEEAVHLFKGGGDFRDMTAGDFSLPDSLEDYISETQSMDPEEALEEREEFLEEIPEGAGDEGDAKDKKALKASNTGLVVLGLGVAGAIMASKGKKKRA